METKCLYCTCWYLFSRERKTKWQRQHRVKFLGQGFRVSSLTSKSSFLGTEGLSEFSDVVTPKLFDADQYKSGILLCMVLGFTCLRALGLGRCASWLSASPDEKDVGVYGFRAESLV